MGVPGRRLFIALPVSDKQAAAALSRVNQILKQNESFLKIVPSDNYHLTLKFFGSISCDTADSLAAAFISLPQLKKINYKLCGIGTFPSISRPSVIWAGLKCDEKPLSDLFKSVEKMALTFGFNPEKKEFIPHLTLARVKKEKQVPDKFRNFISEERDTFFLSSEFNELVLYESILSGKGPEYIKIKSVKLI